MKMYRTDPLTEREKRYLRQVNGTKQAWSADKPAPEIKKVREYNDTIAVDIPRRTKRGFNGCKLDPRIRAIVDTRRQANKDFRANLAAFVRG